jgi:hypothetical protein
MNGASRAAIKELLQEIKFTLDTKDYGLQIKPKETDGPNREMVMYTNIDFTPGDKDSWISMMGFVLFP